MFVHQPVLLNEVIEGLNIQADGIYIDGTFGRGGHSRAIMQCLSSKGKLLAIDKDPEAITAGNQEWGSDPRFCLEQGSFAGIQHFVDKRDWKGKVSGIFLDLGVSSPQLDNPLRGFSFLRDGPLDMRMDPHTGLSAADWINSATEKAIVDILFEYGEERFARRIAKAIVKERQIKPFITTSHLASVIAAANPAWERDKHPATRAFQAIRIFINNELSDLSQCLEKALDILQPGGRLVVLSFHSLEDRIVKRFMRRQSKGETLPYWLPITQEQLITKMRLIGKAVKPGQDEVKNNPRARSAILRIGEKLL
ncbi:MAG: Ribosomal RNA small subunit methyltransferase H [Legionellaceae bacterium]